LRSALWRRRMLCSVCSAKKYALQAFEEQEAKLLRATPVN